MANQSFRDVNTVVLAGVALAGVQRVRLSNEGALLNFHADANAFRQDVGLTKQIAMVDIERMSSSKLRDIVSAVFTSGALTSVTLGRVQRARISQGGTVLRDSGDADSWVRYVGVTDISGDVEATFRDVKQMQSGSLKKGQKGTLTLAVPVSRSGTGLPSSTATETHKVVCMVHTFEKQVGHGEMAEIRARFEMFGATNPWTTSGLTGGAQLKPVTVGQAGSAKWTAPAADAGSAEATTVTAGVVTNIEVTLEHGNYARANYKLEAGASDGVTPPIS
jgi:hypothetical protein